MIERLEGTFFGHKDTELFYQIWRSPKSRGTIVLTHGLAEHSENYNDFANELAEDWTIAAWDLRGHGRSEGKRGYVEDFNDYSTDHDLFIKHIKANVHSHNSPFFLFGHSMGGLITINTILNYAPNGVTALLLSSPALGVSVAVPTFKVKAAHFLADWAPKVTLYNEINFRDLHKNEDLIKKYQQDPLRHEKISPRLFLGMMNTIDTTFAKAGEIHLPTLMQLAGQEKIVNTPASQKFFDLIFSKKKEIFIYPDSYHEIFNDVEKSVAFKDLKNFLQKTVGGE